MPRWSLVLFVVMFAAVAALVLADRDGDADGEPERPAPRATGEGGLGAHLRSLQRIADEHGGTRAAGSSGDAATADYVERRLRAAGYRVTRLAFDVPYHRESAPPRLRVGGRAVRPVRTLQFSPGGTASGRIRSAGLGCAAADFGALREGEIALVRRGTCFFRDKALNAQRGPAPRPRWWSTRSAGRSRPRSSAPACEYPSWRSARARGRGSRAGGRQCWPTPSRAAARPPA